MGKQWGFGPVKGDIKPVDGDERPGIKEWGPTLAGKDHGFRGRKAKGP